MSQTKAAPKTEATNAVDPLSAEKLNEPKTKFQFKVKKHVTLPLLQVMEGKPIYVRIESEIVKAKELVASRAPASGSAMKQPPELIHVVNLESGEHMQVIANTVLASTLRDEYPDNSYVGKSFEILRHKMKEGKNYATFGVTEIEV